MRVYLDVCCLQRPLDDRSQARVNVEAEAVLAILDRIESGQVQLLTSDVIEFEVRRIRDVVRRDRVNEIVGLAAEAVSLTDQIEAIADGFARHGLRSADALHLACAETAAAHYFCTCDDQLLKKAAGIPGIVTRVVTPTQLLEELKS